MKILFSIGLKQYFYKKDNIIVLERLDNKINDIIKINKIFMLDYNPTCIKIGHPYLLNYFLKAKVISHDMGIRNKIIKFKRRKNYIKNIGYRICTTSIKIVGIYKWG